MKYSNHYRVSISENSKLHGDKWSAANDLFRMRTFFDYKQAASYAILAAKSTRTNYEICRLNIKKMLQNSIDVYPSDNSVRQLGFIELP